MSILAYLLFALALGWCCYWLHAATGRIGLMVGVAALGAVHVWLAQCGVYSDTTSFPPPQFLLIAPVLVVLAGMLLLKRGRRWLGGLPLFALTALHVLRIPVELVLHQAYEAGLVPRDMTYSGFNFDIVSGITALALMFWMRSARPPGRAVLLAWNVGALILLGVVVITAVLSIPSSVQRLNNDHPNVLVTAAPWVLLPAVLVPAVLFAHVAALVRLWRRTEDLH